MPMDEIGAFVRERIHINRAGGGIDHRRAGRADFGTNVGIAAATYNGCQRAQSR